MEAPAKIKVFYRPVGASHVFTSNDLPGLHVLRTELKGAYELLLRVTTELVQHTYGVRANYDIANGFGGLRELVQNRNPLVAAPLVLKRVTRTTSHPKRQKAA
jgi:hypothetical protein